MRLPRYRIQTLMFAIVYIGVSLATVRAAVSASTLDWMFVFSCTAALVLCVAASAALTWMFDALLGSHGPPDD